MSLRNTFKAIADFFGIEKNPVTKFTSTQLRDIEKIMKNKRVDLDVDFEYSWPPGHMKNIGLIVPKDIGIMSLLHAQGNLCKAFETVTGQSLEREHIKTYKPIPPEAMQFPMM